MFKFFIIRELTLIWRQQQAWLVQFGFLVLCFSYLPFLLPDLQNKLAYLAPVLLWIGVGIAWLFIAENLFKTDFQDGGLTIWALSPYNFSNMILGRIFLNWLVFYSVLLVLLPYFKIIYGLSSAEQWILMISLALGTPSMALLATLGVALVLSQPKGQLLMGILVLPWYLPIFIFAIMAVNLVQNNLSPHAPLAMLGSLLAFNLAVVPSAISYAIRSNLS